MAVATWLITGIAIAGVILRPFRWPEYVWAIGGAVAVVLIGVLPPDMAAGAVGRGIDVYLFLVGMMLLSEVARQEGLFDYLARHAVQWAAGSPRRLFLIVYAVGTLVTAFLSNDATAVVLTPAVAAATRAARVPPLPYLFVCAFIANAASFVLPISNPANLVLYGEHMPPLGTWLMRFAVPSVLAIGATFACLRLTQSRALQGTITDPDAPEPLGTGGWLTAAGIVVTAIVLLAASGLGWQLGLPTFVCGAFVTALVLLLARQSPMPILRHVAWGVLPLVAGLFVLVAALERTGVVEFLRGVIVIGLARSVQLSAALSGAAVALGANVFNNLPVGLLAASVSHAGGIPVSVTNALLIGVDLGPNLSVTGSLATILWLIALRRENVAVSGLRFLALGVVVMVPALVLALTAVLLVPG